MPKKLRDLRYRLFYGLLVRRNCELVMLGDRSLGVQWTICPDGLGPKSIVYSGGVGTDISFERGLVQRFGCEIVLLDPSPVGLKTMARAENQIPQLRFRPTALAAQSGTITMAGHPDDAESWFAGGEGKATTQVRSTDLASLMKENGHDHIDLLKLDIEGCEYEVIDSVLDRGLCVRQLCADFDYGYVPGVRRSQAIRAILRLALRGYRLVHVDAGNHTFLRSRRK
jgi:FkbM family methyltransferase